MNSEQQTLAPAGEVMTVSDLAPGTLARLLKRFRLQLETVGEQQDIPGSFWGDSEAGLLGDRLLVRADTPVHSALHEACHYICMDGERRRGLDTDAGGGYDEENGVCYLQILLADQLTGVGRDRLMEDMDRWGYSFRLGSTRAWFEEDAGDARDWLAGFGIIDKEHRPTFRLRD